MNADIGDTVHYVTPDGCIYRGEVVGHALDMDPARNGYYVTTGGRGVAGEPLYTVVHPHQVREVRPARTEPYTLDEALRLLGVVDGD